MTDATDRLMSALRPTARTLPESGIVRVFNHGRAKPGLIPMWAGEGDLPTPQFICDAAARSMASATPNSPSCLPVPRLAWSM